MDVKALHNQAMQLAQEAYIAKLKGEEEVSLTMYRAAYELERKAAIGFEAFDGSEPTRSVLFRSAAVLAKNCGKFIEAYELVGTGLSGNPTGLVKEELEELNKELIQTLKSLPAQNQLNIEGEVIALKGQIMVLIDEQKFMLDNVRTLSEGLLKSNLLEGKDKDRILEKYFLVIFDNLTLYENHTAITDIINQQFSSVKRKLLLSNKVLRRQVQDFTEQIKSFNIQFEERDPLEVNRRLNAPQRPEKFKKR